MNRNSLTLRLSSGPARQTQKWVVVGSVLNIELLEKSHGPRIRKTQFGHTDCPMSCFGVAIVPRAGAVPSLIASPWNRFFEYFPL